MFNTICNFLFAVVLNLFTFFPAVAVFFLKRPILLLTLVSLASCFHSLSFLVDFCVSRVVGAPVGWLRLIFGTKWVAIFRSRAYIC